VNRDGGRILLLGREGSFRGPMGSLLSNQLPHSSPNHHEGEAILSGEAVRRLPRRSL
jgi:hypothetical protein